MHPHVLHDFKAYLLQVAQADTMLRCAYYYLRTLSVQTHCQYHKEPSHEKWDLSTANEWEALKLSKIPYIVCANSEGSDETAPLCRLTLAYAVCLCEKCPFQMG